MGAGSKKAGRWVAVGAGGLVFSSDDGGATWDSRTGAGTRDWSNIIFANGKFVAVGSGSGAASRIMHSSDGETWGAATGGNVGSYNWVDVAYGLNLLNQPKFVAFASGRKLLSDNGEAWTDSSPHPPSATNWRAITAVEPRGFIAVRSSSTSGDSATITAGETNNAWVSPNDAKLGEWHSICFGPGIGVVAVGGTAFSNQVMTSTGSIVSGSVWTVRTPAYAQEWLSVCYGAGLFVAVAVNAGYTTGYIMTSPDGASWTGRGSYSGRPLIKVAYGGGQFLALAGVGGGTTYVMSSSDGITWADVGSFSGYGMALAYGEI